MSGINVDHPMAHDRHPMQAWLSIEQNNIPIFQMTINYTARFQFNGKLISEFTIQHPATKNNKHCIITNEAFAI